jgi:hypothetical protein
MADFRQYNFLFVICNRSTLALDTFKVLDLWAGYQIESNRITLGTPESTQQNIARLRQKWIAVK